MKFDKMIALVLTAIMLFVSLASCSSNENEASRPTIMPSNTPVKSAAEGAEAIETPANVYIETRLGVDLIGSGYFYACASGRIYYSETTEIRDDNAALTGNNVVISSVNSDGGDVRTHWTRELTITQDTAAGTECYEFVAFYNADSSGNLWVVINTEIYGIDSERGIGSEYAYELLKISPDGEALLSINLSESVETAGQDVNGILLDKAGNVYVSCYDDSLFSIFVLSGETGEDMFHAREDVDMYSAVTNDGRVVYRTYENGDYRLFTLDAASKSVASSMTYTGTRRMFDIFDGYDDWSICFFDGRNVYGLNLETLEEAIVIDFDKSGVDTIGVKDVCRVSDIEFVMVKIALANPEATGFYKLTYDPDYKTIEKVTITLGAINGAGVAADAVKYFNKISKTTHIEIIDYGARLNNTESYMQAVLQLDMDILTGNAPDIISLGAMSAAKYAEKGVLLDLTDYFENDPLLNRDDMFENILDICTDNGKLYHLIPHFTVFTLIGKTSIFGDGSNLTMETVLEAATQYPDAVVLSTIYPDPLMNWLSIWLQFNLRELIDWENGTCNFDNEEFIEMLNIAKRFPEHFSYANPVDIEEHLYDYEVKFKENRALLDLTSLDYTRSARIYAELFGEEVSFLGFPTKTTRGNTVAPRGDYGISESSEHKDAAWEFISTVLQNSKSIYSGGQSTMGRSKLIAELKEERVPLGERDYSNGVTLYSSMGAWSRPWNYSSPDGFDEYLLETYHLTVAETAKLLSAVDNATRLSYDTPQITEIITEETEAFMNGARSAEETARIIQSRASIYVSENS